MQFEPNKYEKLIDEFGLKQAWINLLATKIKFSGEKFSYILESKLFKEAKFLQEDYLLGLSIGEIGVVYEYSVAYVDVNSRKSNGQYFTPDDVSNLMVQQTLDFPVGKWLDPCSGIGNLSWHLVNAQQNKEEFLKKYLTLSDRDELALIIARVLFTISFQEKLENLYNEIEQCFQVFDFLSVSDNGGYDLFSESTLGLIPKHDFVIVNPPYLSIRGEDSRFETAKSRDLYAYFLENIIKTSKGLVSITPQSFTNASKFRELRLLLMKTYPLIKIFAFDNIPGNIFYGVKYGSSNSNTANSMRAAIMVAREGDGEHQITSLLRWRTSERQSLFSSLDKFLAKTDFSADFFPKVSSVFSPLYKSMKSKPKLDSIIAPKETKYALYIPASPRYFIPALKKPVSRASLKTIYFNSASDMNRAYLLINSSLMYWWWRVRDGGMTLSLETIKSLPMPDFEVDIKLVRDLEKSESSNLVYKLNAGALHENVKHDQSLIMKLNDLILPRFSNRLILTHENSELVQLKRK